MLHVHPEVRSLVPTGPAAPQRGSIHDAAKCGLTICIVLCSIGCAGTSPGIATPSKGGPPAVSDGFAPRLLRPHQPAGPVPGTQASGTLRVVDSDHWHERVLDPATGVVYADAVIPDGGLASIDPSFRTLCVEQREERPGAPTYVGAFDLAANRWLWREILIPGEAPDLEPFVLATPELCAFSHGAAPGIVDLRRLYDGARVTGPNVPYIINRGGVTARWSDDRSTLVLTEPGTTSRGVAGISVDVRDGRTLARRSDLWARCVAVGAQVRIRVHEEIENEVRRAQIAREIPDLLGDCAVEPPVPDPVHRHPILPAPWAPLSPSVVAFHGDTGLFIWNHGHEQTPRRLDPAPLTRFTDVDGSERGEEMTLPPDAEWVGVIRGNGVLARWRTADGAALADIPLPGPLPVTARDAYWQVFAGARDRMLAIRHVRGRRVVFVGDTAGNWRESPVRAFAAVWQWAQHQDTGRAWLVGDGYYGVSLLDESTGKVLAMHEVRPHTWWRGLSPAVSPDGRQVFFETTPTKTDDVGALTVLDASSLRVIRRLPPVEGFRQVEEWRSDGIVIYGGLGVGQGVWFLTDPVAGTTRPLARGDVRYMWQPTRRGDTHVDRTVDGGAFVGGPRGTPEHRLSILDDGGAVIEYPDGTVFCAGSGCAVHRCVVGFRDARPATDPACAHLLRRRP
jgi:hypothetical protein